jgi:hypothetical protein
MTEDKIIEMIVWNITKTEDQEPIEKDEQIETLLWKFSDIFSKVL